MNSKVPSVTRKSFYVNQITDKRNAYKIMRYRFHNHGTAILNNSTRLTVYKRCSYRVAFTVTSAEYAGADFQPSNVERSHVKLGRWDEKYTSKVYCADENDNIDRY